MVYLLLFTMLLAACAPGNTSEPDEVVDEEQEETTSTEDSNEEEAPNTNESIENDEPEEPEEEEAVLSMQDFFPANDVKMHYKGEGNEFAELDIALIHLGDDYIVKREDNGGSYFETVFKISDDKIDIIKEHMIDFEESLPTLEELADMKSIGIYLSKPFQKGETFGDWEIIDISATLETPFEEFSDVLIIENKDSDFISRKYFVRNFGEVKREDIMETEGFDFIVTSTLETVEKL